MKKTANYTFILNIIGTIVASVYIFLFFFYATRACFDDPDHFSIGPINNIGTTMFVFLGVVFFIVGISMIISLK